MQKILVCVYLKKAQYFVCIEKITHAKKNLFKNYLLFFKNCTKEKKQIINLRLPVWFYSVQYIPCKYNLPSFQYSDKKKLVAWSLMKSKVWLFDDPFRVKLWGTAPYTFAPLTRLTPPPPSNSGGTGPRCWSKAAVTTPPR